MSPGFFHWNAPYRGSSHIYDSVMAIGIGACAYQQELRNRRPQQQQQQQTGRGGTGTGTRRGNATQTGSANNRNNNSNNNQDDEGNDDDNGNRMLQRRRQRNRLARLIGQQQFDGASGTVNLINGIRSKRGITVGVYNARLENNDIDFVLTNINTVNGSSFESFMGRTFLFRNGSMTSPPRDIVVSNYNYLSPSIQGIGLGLFGLAELLILFLFIATIWMRKDRTIKLAQPPFILILCIGSSLTSFTIFTLSFDESDGFSQEALDINCRTAPWLFFVGLVTMYTVLFCKMWRVDRVLQFRRKNQVKIIQTIWPLAIMLLLTICILTAWTIVDPWSWYRDFVSMEPPETIGRCMNNDFGAWFGPLAGIMVASTVLALFAAWKTKDIPQNLSDTSTVFYAIGTQTQAWFVGLPVLSVIGSSSTDATYLGRVSMVWILAVSPVMIVVGPRIYTAIQQRKHPIVQARSRTHISGFRIPQGGTSEDDSMSSDKSPRIAAVCVGDP